MEFIDVKHYTHCVILLCIFNTLHETQWAPMSLTNLQFVMGGLQHGDHWPEENFLKKAHFFFFIRAAVLLWNNHTVIASLWDGKALLELCFLKPSVLLGKRSPGCLKSNCLFLLTNLTTIQIGLKKQVLGSSASSVHLKPHSGSN